MWNDRWPPGPASSGVTDKNISYWETWPQSGHEPSLRTLKRLAQLYCCDVGDLIDDGRFGHLDTVSQPIAATREVARYDDAATSVGAAPDTEHPPQAAWAALKPFSKLVLLAEQPSRSLRDRDACYEELVNVLTSWASTMKRRDLLRTLAWAASAAATVPIFGGLDLGEQEQVVRVLDGQHRADDSVVGHIETVLWAAMRQDDALGPQAVLDTVLAQRRLVRTILADCPAALRARLLSLFANLSRFAGWLCFDLSDLDSAAHFYEQARIAAHEAENTELGIFVLCNLSHLATWRGQPRAGIDHAVAATAWASDTDDTLLRAYVADVSARAYARAPGCSGRAWTRWRASRHALTTHGRERQQIPWPTSTDQASTQGAGPAACSCSAALSTRWTRPERRSRSLIRPSSATRGSTWCTWAPLTSSRGRRRPPPASSARLPTLPLATGQRGSSRCSGKRVTGCASGIRFPRSEISTIASPPTAGDSTR